jgi:hypothetical protein
MLTRNSGTVVRYSQGVPSHPEGHENMTRVGIATRLARVLDYAFGGEYEPGRSYPGHLYFVPNDTLVGNGIPALAIRSEQDLFGGTVPYPFLATKAVAHPLVEGAFAPPGWTQALGASVADVVLHGYAAFTIEDARRAGLLMLQSGDARVKRGEGIGGLGQTVVSNAAELDAALDGLDAESLLRHGLVIEENLQEVTTFSVGRLLVGGRLATYVGTQRLTPNNNGVEVYGGSELRVARGDYDKLMGLDLEPSFRMAIQCARKFDTDVFRAYTGILASRRNYDIAQGLDAQGKPRMGVLEQSWRLGGASPAEIAALEAFGDDPALRSVHASCIELYGEGVTVPPAATLYFSGVDARVGRLTKYAFTGGNGSPA